MVTRKPIPGHTGKLAAGPTSPPYPVTPVDVQQPSSFRVQDAQTAMRQSLEVDSEDANAWSDKDRTATKQNQHSVSTEVPQALRVGPPGGVKHKPSQEVVKPVSSTNPFLKKQNTGVTDGKDSIASAWGDSGEMLAPPSNPAPPPPVTITEASPTLNHQFSNLSVSDTSSNPWQPVLEEHAAPSKPSSMPSMSREDSGNEAWSKTAANKPEPLNTEQPVLINADEPESPAWDEDSIPSPIIQEMPATPVKIHANEQILEDQQVWGESQGQGQSAKPETKSFIAHEEPAPQGEGWNIVDREPIVPTGPQETGVVTPSGTVLQNHTSEEQAPPLPPRASNEFPPPQPPRPVIDTSDVGPRSVPGPSSAVVQKQKKETYEIKKITWHDFRAPQNPRVSPILVQNANGPCPLLALVNALTLSTPANVETALVETLRSHEQVSLGLLLDAVFDELMSGRRGNVAQGLPDVSDLYGFLITLHTGMNVNPRFFPPGSIKAEGDPLSTREDELSPGTFEGTREMKLYGTFSVPLIHGWLPERDSQAYRALKRTAQSYEDAQNIFFHEEVLEEKLRTEGLSFEEQAILEDIGTIKAFFNSAATQLTTYGLEAITTSIAPGSIAILFRNDHFSTLYRHPETRQLLQLVTDMGYAGHEEVVWESLIDVNGENAEFFSGDFRLVGGAPASPTSRQNTQTNQGWTSIPIRNQNRQNVSSSNNEPPPTPHSPNIEQEDHDLALALQLQEEEEERHRNELARRRRETELSQQYIEQQGRGSNIPVTRGGGSNRGQGRGRGREASDPRPAIPPRRNNPPPTNRPSDPDAGVDAPPPSYEQAATQEPYVPPTNHPAHPNSSPSVGRRSSGFSGSVLHGRRPTLVDQIDPRRRQGHPNISIQPVSPTSPQGGPSGQESRKDCVIM